MWMPHIFDNLFHNFPGVSPKNRNEPEVFVACPKQRWVRNLRALESKVETKQLWRKRRKCENDTEIKMNIEWTWCYSHPFWVKESEHFAFQVSFLDEQKHRVAAWNFTKEGRWRSNSWPPRDESHRWRGWEVFLGRACCKLCFKISTNMHHFQVRSMSPHCRSVGSRELS